MIRIKSGFSEMRFVDCEHLVGKRVFDVNGNFVGVVKNFYCSGPYKDLVSLTIDTGFWDDDAVLLRDAIREINESIYLNILVR